MDQYARQQWRGVRLLVPKASHGLADGRLDATPLQFLMPARRLVANKTSYEQKQQSKNIITARE
ncbi:hypothetical protein KUH03_08495 [Sphingobacterium sp. E70]|uniref:hypothetical protein n=1 Tax=Sphingobacterium sp. E70 TaxID=2853439 RepID=UPI00211C0BFE|nr:hypothetical protein [Sphingobacterium sp. E70]ULT26850.1 hypothetical protein KUH03_08495 [Sphingobacterium sp. E70]